MTEYVPEDYRSITNTTVQVGNKTIIIDNYIVIIYQCPDKMVYGIG